MRIIKEDITTDGVDKIKLPNGITVNWYSSLSQVPHGKIKIMARANLH